MQQSANEKDAPETGNFQAQLSSNLNLEMPVPTVAFQEKLKEYPIYLTASKAFLGLPRTVLQLVFERFFSDFVLAHKQSTEAETWLAKPSMQF